MIKAYADFKEVSGLLQLNNISNYVDSIVDG